MPLDTEILENPLLKVICVSSTSEAYRLYPLLVEAQGAEELFVSLIVFKFYSWYRYNAIRTFWSIKPSCTPVINMAKYHPVLGGNERRPTQLESEARMCKPILVSSVL